jgi:DNA-binding response OmpR family regulator
MRRPPLPPARLRIAAIDRDSRFLDILAEHVQRLDWTFLVHTGPVTGATLRGGHPHAVLVDIGLFGPHWDDWLARHPARIPELGVIVCTGQSSLGQRVRGLGVGADDWITKPCHPAEVIARLEAVVRRSHHGSLGDDPQALGGELELRTSSYEAYVGGRPVRLTAREFEILLRLGRNRGKVVEREEIYRAVWGYEMARGDRSIDTFVRKIRSKLRAISPGWSYIHTDKGVGYRFDPERVGRKHASPLEPRTP